MVDQILQDGHFNNRVLMSITIGSPHYHFPLFLIPERSHKGSKKQLDEVPTVHILSGPGDLQVPATSAWSGYISQRLPNKVTFEVDMDNIPGVWTTSSHKGLVSCNQLVRKIVPLILDTILLDSKKAVSTDDIYHLMKVRLTSNISLDIQNISARRIEANVDALTFDSDCIAVLDNFHVTMLESLDEKTPACFIWKIEPSESNIYQIAIHGLRPGRDIKILATGVKGSFNLGHLFSPLPALSIVEPTENKRFWQDVIRGVDWMQNSTWILDIYSTALEKEGARALKIVLDDRKPLIGGQGFSVVLSSDGARSFKSGETFQQKSVIKIDLSQVIMKYHWPISKLFSPLLSWRQLALMIPLKLVFKIEGCPNHQLLPVFISQSSPQYSASDHIFATQRYLRTGMPLWDPAIVSNDFLFAVVDPRCSYSIKIQQDLLSAISYSNRYQIYALPGLLLSLSILRLAPIIRSENGLQTKYPSLKKYCTHCLGITALALVISRLLHLCQPGSLPWLYLLTPIGVLSILWTSICLDIMTKMIFCTMLNLMIRIYPRRKSIQSIQHSAFKCFKNAGMLVMLLSCMFHDFAPFYIALMYSIAFYQQRYGNVIDYSPLEWVLILLSGVAPMVVAMSGGHPFGYNLRETYGFSSLERLLVIFISLASTRKIQIGSSGGPQRGFARNLLSYASIFCSLFGYNFILPFIVAAICLDEVFPH